MGPPISLTSAIENDYQLQHAPAMLTTAADLDEGGASMKRKRRGRTVPPGAARATAEHSIRESGLLVLLTRGERGTLERARTVQCGDGGPSLATWAREILLEVAASPRDRAARMRAPSLPMDLRERIRLVERAAIDAALARTDNNQSHAADLLGISRRGLIIKLEQHGFKARPLSQGGDSPAGSEGLGRVRRRRD